MTDAMLNPSHPGETIRDCIEEMGWTVTYAAGQLGVARHTLSRLLNGRSGISPSMALALERIGWSNAGFWMRRQASWDLAQARLREGARAA